MNSTLEAQEWLLRKNHHRFVIPAARTGHAEAIWNLYKQHVGCFWTQEEIDLSEDVKDWAKLSENEQYFISHILAFFAASDGIVNENLAARFMQEVQIPEARAFYGFQIAMENIHSETYTAMLNILIRDAAEQARLLNAIETIPSIKKKAEWAIQWTRSETASFAERLVAFACVEGIMFSGAFCSIFWLRKRNLLKEGLGKSNEFIARDEGLHRNFACYLYRTLEYTRLEQERVHAIVRDAVSHEIEFICESLPVNLIGMNHVLMTQYIRFVADDLLHELGYGALFGDTNPFDFMEIQSLQGKTNFFEGRVSEYSRALSRSVDGVSSGGERTFSLDEEF
jgi:ribonucleoside-diphosphate reductase beta chain